MYKIYFFIIISLAFTYSLQAQCNFNHTIFLSGGETELYFCEGQQPSSVFMRSSTYAFQQAFVLTYSTGDIISVTNRRRISIEGLRQGTYRIYSILYRGRLLETEGENISNARMTTFCWKFSDNYVTIGIASSDDIEIEFEDGVTEATLCKVDADSTEVTIFSSGGNFRLLLLDDQGHIVGVKSTNQITGAGLETGNYQLVGVSFDGTFLAAEGDEYDPELLVDGCFSVSNFLELKIDDARGGTVFLNNSSEFLWICPGDSILTIDFSVEGNSNLPYYFFLVDYDQRIVLIESQPTIDVSLLGEGTYQLIGGSSSGPPLLNPGELLNYDAAFEGDCFDWSVNMPILRYEQPLAGTLGFKSSPEHLLYFCPGSFPDSLEVFQQSADGVEYRFVFSDSEGKIRELSSDGIFYDLPDSGLWVINGLAFTGDFLLGEGDNFLLDDISSACFSISQNQLFILFDEADGGEISWQMPTDSLIYCTGDGRNDPFVIGSNSQSQLPYFFLLLDQDDLIVKTFYSDTIELEGIEEGSYFLYGISAADPGLFTESTSLDSLDSCFQLSENSFHIDALKVGPAEVFLQGGSKRMDFCPLPGETAKIRVFRNLFTPFYGIALTDSSGNYIRSARLDSMDIGNLSTGEYFIYGIGALDTIRLEVGESIFDTEISSSCFAITDSPISLFIDEVDGSVIDLDGSDMDRIFCSSDLPDHGLQLRSESTSILDYRFLLLDTAFNFIQLLNGDSIDISALTAGHYLIGGISLGGNLNLRPGDHLLSHPEPADFGCYDLSENFISLVIFEAEVGSISFGDGSNEWVLCPVGNNSEVVFSPGQYSGEEFHFLIIDSDGILLDFTDGLFYDFGNLSGEVFFIYGLATSGDLVLEPGIHIDSQEFSSFCYKLSDETLILFFETPDGGQIFESSGLEEVSISVGPGQPDTVGLINTSQSAANYKYVLTTSTGVIIRIFEEDYLIFNFPFLEELHVYGLSYTGNFTLAVGNAQAFDPASDDCYEWSENYLTIFLSLAGSSGSSAASFESPSGELEFLWKGPNPARGEISFKLERDRPNCQPLRFIILDRSGIQFLNGSIESVFTDQIISLEINHLPGGWYLLYLQSGDEIITKGFFVE